MPLTPDDLARTADRFCHQPAFVGHRLRQHGDDATIAARIGITVDQLHHLQMCLMPRPDHYDADLADIARHVGADVEALRSILAPESAG